MVVDFHSHILPQIDDGSSSLKESIWMLRKEAAQGVGHVVATPHFYARHDSPERFLYRRQESELRLRDEMTKWERLPRLTVGAEVYYFPGMSESEFLPYLTIGQTRYILVEMPSSPWTEQMYEELQKIYKKQKLIPVIAHVDRYIGPFRTYRIPERLESLPVMVQANASFFLRRTTEGMAMRLLKEDRIHLLGSDCHNLKDRPPNLGEAVKKIETRLGKKAIKQIQFYENEILHSRKS